MLESRRKGGEKGRNLKPAALRLAAIREANRTCTRVSNTALQHKSKQIITAQHRKAVTPAQSPQSEQFTMLAAFGERSGGGRGAAHGLQTSEGKPGVGASTGDSHGRTQMLTIIRLPSFSQREVLAAVTTS